MNVVLTTASHCYAYSKENFYWVRYVTETVEPSVVKASALAQTLLISTATTANSVVQGHLAKSLVVTSKWRPALVTAATLVELDAERTGLRQELALASRVADGLRAELKQAQEEVLSARRTAESEAAAQRDELARLRGEMQFERARWDAASTAEVAKATRLENEVARLEKMLNATEADAQQQRKQLEATLAELAAEVEHAKEELATREAEALRKLGEEADKRRAAVREKEAAGSAALKDAQRASEELAAEKEQCEKLRDEAAELQREIASAVQVSRSESAQVAALQQQLETLSAERLSLGAKLQAQWEAQSQVQTLQMEAAATVEREKAGSRRLQEAYVTIAALEELACRLRGESTTLREELAAAVRAADELRVKCSDAASGASQQSHRPLSSLPRTSSASHDDAATQPLQASSAAQLPVVSPSHHCAPPVVEEGGAVPSFAEAARALRAAASPASPA